MVIRYAVWLTGVPPVCTAYWGQADWDTFAEGYRPAGYTGDAHDTLAYMLWGAQKLVDALRAEQARLERKGGPLDLSEMDMDAALCRDALRGARVCRESRRGNYCAMGECFVCTVARVHRGES